MKKVCVLAFSIFLILTSTSMSQQESHKDEENTSGVSDDDKEEMAGLIGTSINEFQVNKIYKAIANFPYAVKVDDGEKYKNNIIFKKTQILVRSKGKLEDGGFRFFFIPLDTESHKEGSNGVIKDELYYFDTKQKPEIYFREWSSIAHGTLIVPFKLRTKDGQLTGDATLGYYVGYVWKWWDLDLIPLISAGITPISVAVDTNDTDTKLGVTAAIGIVLKHAGNFQIGIVSGLDHLGGSSGDNYEYEDDIWVSFMIGYNFAN